MTNLRIVTGCAGFIGSNLVDSLLAQGHQVLGIDNLSTGQRRFLADALANPAFTFVTADLADPATAAQHFGGAEIVYHLSANADVRFGALHPRRDLEQNTIVTFNVLEGMRANAVRRIVFSSTGSVYGEASVIPTPEDAPFPVQTSLYGASKLACEGLIAAYCETYGFQAWIFRFVSILGHRYTHGHVFDFYRQLLADPKTLRVLGDGRQRKSYLDVSDCLAAVHMAVARGGDPVNVFNLGVDGYCEVRDSIRWITEALGVTPELVFGGGDRGWVGDNPFIYLDASRMRALGWQPQFSIEEGVRRTVDFLRKNEWVFENRS